MSGMTTTRTQKTQALAADLMGHLMCLSEQPLVGTGQHASTLNRLWIDRVRKITHDFILLNIDELNIPESDTDWIEILGATASAELWSTYEG